jgi:transposase-like protein
MSKRNEGSEAASGGGGEGAAAERFDVPERWSAAKKAEVVLRLLRGEEIGAVSREIQVPAHVVEEWRRVFVESGRSGLRTRGEPDGDRELTRARAKVGELMMELELAEDLLKKRGYGEDLKKLGR